MTSIIPVRPFGKDLSNSGQSLDDHLDESNPSPISPSSSIPDPNKSGVQNFSVIEYDTSWKFFGVEMHNGFYSVDVLKNWLFGKEWWASELVAHANSRVPGENYRGLSMNEYHAIARSLWMNQRDPLYNVVIEDARKFLKAKYAEHSIITLSRVSEVVDRDNFVRNNVIHHNHVLSGKIPHLDHLEDSIPERWEQVLGYFPMFPQSSRDEAVKIYQWLCGKPLQIDGRSVLDHECYPISFGTSPDTFYVIVRPEPSVKGYSLVAEIQKIDLQNNRTKKMAGLGI